MKKNSHNGNVLHGNVRETRHGIASDLVEIKGFLVIGIVLGLDT